MTAAFDDFPIFDPYEDEPIPTQPPALTVVPDEPAAAAAAAAPAAHIPDPAAGEEPHDAAVQEAADLAFAAIAQAAEPSVAEHIAARDRGMWLLNNDDVVIYRRRGYAPELGEEGRHGLYHVEQVEVMGRDGSKSTVDRYAQISDWFAFRESVTEKSIIDPGGELQLGEAPEYVVTVVDPRGKAHRTPPLSAADAVKPDVVLAALRTECTLPLDAVGPKRIRNMLMKMGFSGMQVHRELTQMGWHWQTETDDEGRETRTPVYAAPAGSVGVDGIAADVTVGPPIGSKEGALNKAQSAMGHSRILEDEELRAAAGAIGALMDIAPERPELGIALLGITFAAPLMLQRRGGVYIAASPGVGKSLVASCAQAFISQVGIDGASFHVPVPRSSAFGAEVATQWARHSVCSLEDYRITEDRRTDEVHEAVLTTVAQNAYGSDSGQKGTAAGGVRGGRAAETTFIGSGEALPERQQAIVQRMVTIQLLAGDIDNQGSVNAVDVFRAEFGDTGLANALFGTYLQWIARKIDSLGDDGIRAFALEADEVRRRHYQEYRAGRAGETVATVATGIDFLYRFADEAGIAAALPEREGLFARLQLLVTDMASLHEESSAARKILATLAQLLATGKLFIDDYDQERPLTDWGASMLGWHYQYAGDVQILRPKVSATRAGFYSVDGEHVHLFAQTIREVANAAGFRSRTAGQLQEDFRALVADGTTPGGRPKAAVIGKGTDRTRGYSFSVRTLGLPQIVRTEADAKRKKARADADASGAGQ